jgi:hypothetical protein
MNITAEELAVRMAEKTVQQLLDMFVRPAEWSPQALDAARAELQKRNVRPVAIASQPANAELSVPSRQRRQNGPTKPDVVLQKSAIRKAGLKNLAFSAAWFLVIAFLVLTGHTFAIMHFLEGLAQFISGGSKGAFYGLLLLLATIFGGGVLLGWIIALPPALIMLIGYYPGFFVGRVPFEPKQTVAAKR